MAKTLHQLQLEMSLMRRHRREPKAEVAAELLTRILIVADDRLAGRHLARMLTGMGYAGVRAVNSAARALVLAQQYAPGIIFLDVGLRDDSYELARALQRQAGKDAPRLIALTRSIEHSTREQARSAGFERWLVTPVVQNELDDLLRRDDNSGAT